MAYLRITLRIAIVLALAYCLYVVAARYFGTKTEPPQKRNAELNPLYAGDQLKILHFYSSTPLIEAGDSATLCYGVLNAKAVKIEPYVDGVGPALSRCVAATPKKTTRYTLSAQGKDGTWISASAEVRVTPKP